MSLFCTLLKSENYWYIKLQCKWNMLTSVSHAVKLYWKNIFHFFTVSSFFFNYILLINHFWLVYISVFNLCIEPINCCLRVLWSYQLLFLFVLREVIAVSLSGKTFFSVLVFHQTVSDQYKGSDRFANNSSRERLQFVFTTLPFWLRNLECWKSLLEYDSSDLQSFFSFFRFSDFVWLRHLVLVFKRYSFYKTLFSFGTVVKLAVRLTRS